MASTQAFGHEADRAISVQHEEEDADRFVANLATFAGLVKG